MIHRLGLRHAFAAFGLMGLILNLAAVGSVNAFAAGSALACGIALLLANAIMIAAGAAVPVRALTVNACASPRSPVTDAVTVSAELTARLAVIRGQLGDIPHASLTAISMRKVTATRLLKVSCVTSGYIVRVTRKWLDELGARFPFGGGGLGGDGRRRSLKGVSAA